MGDRTRIEWTEATWNPTTGCDRVSPGCTNCYALEQAARMKAMGVDAYQNDGNPRTSGPGFLLAMHHERLTQPLRWTKPRRIFVNSMSDLFHPDVTDDFLVDVFAVMAATPRHTYQILTKRHARMAAVMRQPGFALRVQARRPRFYTDRTIPPLWRWPLPNVWLGVSVEDQSRAQLRIPTLLRTPAAVRFLSCEPLLDQVTLFPWIGGPSHDDRPPIGWVIAGGESGPRFRPVHPVWVRSLRDECVAEGVPFMFKQWGGRTPKAGGRELDGRTWDEYPTAAVVR